MLYFFFRQQIRMAGKGALNFGKSKARMLARDKNKITFKDVAGVEEAKEEVQEIVEFLQGPEEVPEARRPHSEGRADGRPSGHRQDAARESDRRRSGCAVLFSISGSDFVEMFVGVGASRVRDMFEQGKKSAPCLIFIDEIDAVGRHRGHGLGGGHDEREQTLNALLVEMDGFDTQEGVIIIAATNRPDVLDPALLRPGPLRPPGHRESARRERPRGDPQGAREEGEAGAKTSISPSSRAARPVTPARNWPTSSTKPRCSPRGTD